MTLNDAMLLALDDAGFAGTLDDAMLDWLRSTGATGTTTADCWGQYLAAEGYLGGTLEDRLLRFYRDLAQAPDATLNDAALITWRDMPPTIP